MASAGDNLLVVGVDLVAGVEVHIADRPMEQWYELSYGGNRTVVCLLCWMGVDGG